MGIFSAIIQQFKGDNKQAEIVQPEPLSPERSVAKREMDAIVARLNESIADLYNGHREQRREKAERLQLLVDEAEKFNATNQHAEITNLDKVKNVARDALCKSVPLHTTTRHDTYFICILDTETTGLGHDDEPISVAALLVEVSQKYCDHIREIDRYVGFREPSVPISPNASQIHGLTIEKLAGKSFDMERLHCVIDSAEIIVAHNADFDYRMMAKVMPKITEMPWGCSINDLRWAWKEMTGGKTKLDYICSVFGIEKSKKHDAMGDVEALYKVLQTRTGKTSKSRTLLHPLVKKVSKEYGLDDD